MAKKPLILIVDDIQKNIQVLGSTLLEHNYDIHVAQNGLQAIDATLAIKPDLILLDVIMPKLDGFETCRRLKSDESTKHIPIIFLTAKTTEEDLLQGFQVGGVDYVIKPFSAVVLLARVKTHLSLKLAYEKLDKQKVALEETEILRQNVEHIIQHDLKSPLNGIITFSNLLAEESNLGPGFQKKALTQISRSGHQMLKMINRVADLYKMEMGDYRFFPKKIDIIDILNRILPNHEPEIKRKQLSIVHQHAHEIFTILGEDALCYSMLDNLLKNAIEASPKEAQITVILSEKDNYHISIHNQGVVPKEIRHKFFEKYITANKTCGTGLGTYSAKLMAETQGGTIYFETSETQGTTVTIQLPITTVDQINQNINMKRLAAAGQGQQK